MVHRKALLEALAEELPPGTIRFSSKLISIHTHITHEDFSIATLQLDDGTIIKAKVLVGCDGVHSVVAQWLGLKAPVHSGRVAVHSVRFRFKRNKNEHRMVHRKALLEALAEELPLGTIRFSSKLISIHTHITDEGFSIATLQLDDGTIIKAKVLVGCDGLHSVVAQWLGLKAPVHCGRVAVRGLAVFPQGHGFKQEFQQFVKPGVKAAFVPINDKDLYWYMNYHSSSTGEEFGGDPKLILREVKENLAKDFPPTFLEVVWHADLSSIHWAPLMYRQPWDVIWGHLCKGNVTVAGDAMHPMTPGLGQGGGSALEDAVVLGRHIGNSFLQNGGRIMPAEVDRAIKGYVKERRWRASGLITASYLAGWAQHVKSGWLTKLIRDIIFYKLLYSFIFGSTYFDCGELPRVPSKVE